MKTRQTQMLLALLLSVTACKKESSSSGQSSLNQPTESRLQENMRTAGNNGPQHINPSNFVDGIDNPYFPLLPGTIYHYVNTLLEGGNVTVEHITVTVTHDTKVILGVTCEVIHDEVKTNGKITEDTYDWYTQDKSGNVWYFGEDTKSYNNGNISTEGSWEAGVDGAVPGITMFGNPDTHIGQTYHQEYYKGKAEDEATLLNANSTATVAYGTFNNCVVTKEFTRLEPGVLEYKYYAPGVGQVLTVLNEGGQEREELISISHK